MFGLYFERNNTNIAAKIVIKYIDRYIPQFIPSLENQKIVMDQLLNKSPTELIYIERTVFRKDVNSKDNWTFPLTWVTVVSPLLLL